jgi:hypothetical protein
MATAARLDEVIAGGSGDEADRRSLRRLAFVAAEAMGRENTAWHELVRRYRDDLP